MLRPGLTLAWRSDDALQLGVDDPNPVVLNGLPAQCRAALALMDGTSTGDAILARLAATGPTDGICELIDRLMAMGALVDGGRWPGGANVAVAARDQLLPDLMARAPRDPDRWWESLARTHVTVVGASRLGAIIACALSSGGVGRVTVDDSRPVTAADVALGGFQRSDVGQRRSELLASRADLQTMKSSAEAKRQIWVITDAVDIDAKARSLTAQHSPFLIASCRERVGWVGPLVVPGVTACHFCVQLHRRDHDPAWPQVWRQRTWDATPVALASAAAVTAHIAASHVVEWTCGAAVPSMRGVVEVDSEFGMAGFHPTPPHPECGCVWASLAAS
ncbi:MAG: TOMM precursor leader peptide-binding protein [Actinomycetes bacterium]